MNFFEKLLDVLKQDSRFFSAEGELLRNAVGTQGTVLCVDNSGSMR